ncbi:hypothetical protein RND81_03G105900 [Saponaria officinalis]|uniref:HD domain-containing protein n=1 Tax=Saponaria officinalis TaxID=3572 RepID=A0AAW1M6W6_SAPOF
MRISNRSVSAKGGDGNVVAAEAEEEWEEVNEDVIRVFKEGGDAKRVDLCGLKLRILPEAFGRLRRVVHLVLSTNQLQTTKRAGWVKRNVDNPESISDHMYRMSLMALISSDFLGVIRDKCVKMAIVHDIAEAIVGDITPCDWIFKTEKKIVENKKRSTIYAVSLAVDREHKRSMSYGWSTKKIHPWKRRL